MLSTPPNSAQEPARSRRGVGARVPVARDPGLAPARAAVVVGPNHVRPHLVEVRYLHVRSGAWMARARILAAAGDAA